MFRFIGIIVVAIAAFFLCARYFHLQGWNCFIPVAVVFAVSMMGKGKK
jgi:hypothetical protein